MRYGKSFFTKKRVWVTKESIFLKMCLSMSSIIMCYQLNNVHEGDKFYYVWVMHIEYARLFQV